MSLIGYDESVYRKVLNKAVGSIRLIERDVDEICERGYSNIYLVGSGGTYSMASPVCYLLKTHSTVPWYWEIAAELATARPRSLGPGSVLLTASLTGTTSETIEAARYARSVGATVIALVGNRNCPLAAHADYVYENPSASNDNLVEEIYIQYFAIAARFMRNRGEFDEYDAFVSVLHRIPDALQHVREANDIKAQEFAAEHRDTEFFMCVGAGNVWGETYCFAMCVTEEMLWTATKSIHAAEFFHGTIEMTSPDMNFMLFKGEDETRALVERVEHFVRKHTEHVRVWDTAEFALDGIDPALRPLISPLVMSALLERVSTHLAAAKNHNLDARRFYRKAVY